MQWYEEAHHVDVGGVTVLQELGGGLKLLAGTAVNLGGDLLELAGNVGCVTVQHGSIAVANLARVVHDDDLHINTISTARCLVDNVQDKHDL